MQAPRDARLEAALRDAVPPDRQAVMAALADVGIDYDDVVDKLERDGLTMFQASWAALAETLQQMLAAATRGSEGEEDPP
jgi:transaldolase